MCLPDTDVIQFSLRSGDSTEGLRVVRPVSLHERAGPGGMCARILQKAAHTHIIEASGDSSGTLKRRRRRPTAVLIRRMHKRRRRGLCFRARSYADSLPAPISRPNTPYSTMNSNRATKTAPRKFEETGPGRLCAVTAPRPESEILTMGRRYVARQAQ